MALIAYVVFILIILRRGRWAHDIGRYPGCCKFFQPVFNLNTLLLVLSHLRRSKCVTSIDTSRATRLKYLLKILKGLPLFLTGSQWRWGPWEETREFCSSDRILH